MKKYKVTLNHELILSAVDEEDAKEKYMQFIEDEIQQTYMSFVGGNLEAKEIK